MKTITFSIDLKSFFLGVFTVGGILLMTNSKPADKPNAEPTDEVRRYQALVGEHETLILDTKTGHFIHNPNPGIMGQPRWIREDFNTVAERGKR